jgi:hypothetical protein
MRAKIWRELSNGKVFVSLDPKGFRIFGSERFSYLSGSHSKRFSYLLDPKKFSYLWTRKVFVSFGFSSKKVFVSFGSKRFSYLPRVRISRE